MIRNIFKVMCIIAACNLITADIVSANYNSYDKTSFSSLLKEHSSLFALLSILGCGIAYKLFTKESAQVCAEQLKKEHNQSMRFEKQRQQRYAQRQDALRKQQQREDELEEEKIRQQQEWEKLGSELAEQEELRRQGLPTYLTGGLRGLYTECHIPFRRTPFEVLGVKNDASEAELKKAFRRESLRWHPDKNPAPNARARFQLVNECYQRCLKMKENPTL